ncbi:Slr0243 protein [Geminocystis sp. NIES-3708]|uniref:hypothetical protein n=1 Tax=Geminocystis sp. NIES-3708 TaxID=1615909 RepID=UPI0005FC7C22|nr:hypothetical protein [Geminocystis sp. NIES-3708]BAQ62851.1 Slr0243 protein [Geminocystis sp. NIES-3708]
MTNKILLQICLFILVLCTGCENSQPPLEFAPNPPIIEKAIIFKLQRQHQYLSEQLQIKAPKLHVTKINIEKIEPTMINNLPTYHLEGTYKLDFKQNRGKNRIINNSFNLDLQRQPKGYTWRILINTKEKNSEKYSSYQIW